MNTIRKIGALALLCLLASPAVNAQQTTVAKPAENQSAQLQKKWFSMEDSTDARFRFTIASDKGETLVVRFQKLSDWTNQEDFRNALSAGEKVLAVYRDSLEQAINTQVLDIHIPANNKTLISRFHQYNESGQLMAITNDGAAALKVGTDTLRILQQKQGMGPVQYTFLLKKLGDYSVFAGDETWKKKVGEKIDSMVMAYRMKWKNPESKRHGLLVTYDPGTGKTSVGEDWRLRGDALLIEGGIGISLVRNMLCPNAEYGLGIYLHRDHDASTFLRLSSNSFYRFQETSPNKFRGYATTFLNLEFGSESNHNNPKSLFYKTSLGFGYKLVNKKEERRDPTMDKEMYRFFFSYSINKFFVLTPELITNFKKGDQKNSWFGLSLNLKLF